MKLDAVLESIDGALDDSVEQLFELLKIKSISTDPQYAPDCVEAANWLVDYVGKLGFEARAIATEGHPMVVAHYKSHADAPHVLFYGHYDVQPVDPLSEWHSPPFEPSVRTMDDGSRQILARGSSDDKGQLMTFVEACRAWISESGNLPCNVTLLFEGEEESGSPSLEPFLAEYGDEITADIALVCDTNMWDRDTPAISTALRGLVGQEINVTAANRDLHSGYYGSAAANPIRIVSDILSSLHDDEGRVTLDGFYDGVPDIPAEIQAQWDQLGFSSDEFLGEVGLSIPAGEKEFGAMEQTWSRPTAEINGIWGGYSDEGFKTVIPSKAGAKISFRLVGTQDPEKIKQAFQTRVKEMIPGDCSVEFADHGAGPALQLDYKLPQLKSAGAALEAEWGKPTALIAMGGSVPIVGDFKRVLGMDSLMVGFALADDAIHSPNEKYELRSFHKGIRSWARILDALSK